MRVFTEGAFHVFTFKEGLLSRLAHDLRLSLERFRVEARPDGTVVGQFFPDSLVVDGTMKQGRLDPDGLKPKEYREVEGNMQREVLRTAQHAAIEFLGTIEGNELRGHLGMVGTSVPISLRITESGGRYRGEIELTPSRWGIAPFKALMGAIRVQDRVKIAFELTES